MNTLYKKEFKCIRLTLDEFTRMVETMTGGLKTVEFETKAMIVDSDKADVMNTYWEEHILETMSKYINEPVVSFHAEDCSKWKNESNIAVWIIYR